MKDSLVPTSNVNIFKTLFVIENGLRELIIDTLSSTHGPFWYKNRMIGDALTKFKEARKYESNIKWQNLVPHHPIYYIDFTHLRPIIHRQDNWDQHFKSIFGNRELFAASLTEIEFIRNKIAHNRKTSKADEIAVMNVFAKLVAQIGASRLEELASRSTSAPEIPELVKRLRHETDQSLESILTLKPLESLSIWELTKNQWWFDESYLCNSIAGVKNFYGLVANYIELPRRKGTGHIIQGWVRNSDISSHCIKALADIDKILQGIRG